jgi:hypothetical protein
VQNPTAKDIMSMKLSGPQSLKTPTLMDFSSGISTNNQQLFNELKSGLAADNGLMLNQLAYQRMLEQLANDTPLPNPIVVLKQYANAATKSILSNPDLAVAIAMWTFYYQERKYNKFYPTFNKALVTANFELAEFLYQFIDLCRIPVTIPRWTPQNGVDSIFINWDERFTMFDITGLPPAAYDELCRRTHSLQDYICYKRAPVLFLATREQIDKCQSKNLGVAEC